MKLRELFANINQSVIEEGNKLISLKRKETLTHEILIIYEKKLSWHYLKLLFSESDLDKECTSENLKPYYNFLANRWTRINNIYQLSYTYNYKDKLTLICYKLAVKLAEFQGNQIHVLKILMPSIETYNANLMMDLVEIDALASKDEKIQLHHFIIDHWGNIINVNDCLKYASYSIKETILFHTSAQSSMEEEKSTGIELPQARVLDHKDKIRVTYHSKESAAVIQTINQLVKENDTLCNAADAIDNLVQYLEKGGMSGGYGGTNADSGFYSYIGIRKFYDFIKDLSADNYSTLMTASVVFNTHSIDMEMIWAHLLASALFRPECNFSGSELERILAFIHPYYATETPTKRTQRNVICAEQFALKLKEIKKANPRLDQIKQDKSKSNKETILRELDYRYKQAQEQFENAILKNKLTHFTPKEIEELPVDTHKALKDEIDLPAFCKRLANTNIDLVEILIMLPNEMHICLMKNLGPEFLKKIIATAAQLIEVFQRVSRLENIQHKKYIHQLILINLSKEYLREIIVTERSRTAISKYLTTDLFLDFIPPKVSPTQKFNLFFLNQKWTPGDDDKSEQKNHDDEIEYKHGYR